jgi:gliding motility-associated-like protein
MSLTMIDWLKQEKRKGIVLKSLLIYLAIIISASVSGQEICDNGLDDDGDGLIDCYDSDCVSSPLCGLPDASCEIVPDPVNAEFAIKLECAYLKGGFTVNGVNRNFTPYGYDTPKAGDVDGDGKVEILAVGDGYGGTGDEGIYIFDPSICEPKYYIPHDISGNHGGVSFANVDADAYAEIFLTTGNDGCTANANSLIRYDYDGTNWNETWVIPNIYQKRGFPADFVDFDEDGTPEIIVYGETTAANRTARIMRASDGVTLVNLATNTTFFNRLYWKDVYAYADVIPAGFDPDGAGPLTPLLYAAGPEVIVGNRIFTVDIASGNFEEVYTSDPLTSTGAASDHYPWCYNFGDNTNPAGQQDGDAGQKISLADVNKDGNLDIIVVGQGRLSVWDPLTNQRLYPTYTLAGSKGGTVCVGDVDNDPNDRPEFGIISNQRIEIIKTNAANTALQQIWVQNTTDASGETATNFFDFEGDGTVELVYRDQDTLKVYVGIGNGSGQPKILFQDPNHCGSGTGGEHPIVADIDNDNRAEIIASCTEGIRVYRDNRTPWISARKVFNQRAYNYVNVNDNNSIPRVQQQNHKVPYLNNYLTQLYQIDKSGDQYFPSPDFTVEIEDVSTDVDIASSCPDKVIIRLKICNRGDALANYTIPLSFYQNDPRTAGAIFLKKSNVTVTLNANECYKTEAITISLSDLVNANGLNDGNLFFVVNDDADGLAPNQVLVSPISIPNSPYGECNYTNNVYGPIKIADCHYVPIIHLLSNDITSEDQPITFTALGSNQIFVTDYDNDPQTVTITVTGGSLSLSGIAGLSFTNGDGTSDDAMTFSGSVSDVNAALNNAIFMPGSNFNGTAIIQVSTTDGLGTDAKTITVAVSPVNDNPEINDVNVVGTEDNTITFLASYFTNAYSDLDADALNKIKIITLPPFGTLNLSGVAVLAGQEIPAAQLGNLTYVPDANWNGAITCDYNSSDGTVYALASKKIWFTITGVNDLPVLSDIYKATTVNTTITMAPADFTAGFYDADSNPLEKIKITSLPSYGTLNYSGSPVGLLYEVPTASLNLLTYVPNTGYSGADEFYWNAYDGLSYALTDGKVRISISNTNVPPVVSAFSKSGTEDNAVTFALADFSSNYTDANADPMANMRIETLPLNGILKLSGVAVTPFHEIAAASIANLTFTPSANWSGTTTFNWKAFDGLTYSAVSAIVTLNISGVNDAPSINDISKSGTENVTLPFSAADFINSYTDIDGDALSKIQVVSLPANGNLQLSGVNITVGQEIATAQLPNITFVPAANWYGTTSFTWNGSDGAAYATATKTVNIDIANVNNAPVLSGIEGGSVAFTEDDSPVMVTSSLAIADIDNATLRNATVKITGNYNPAQDVLSFTNTGTITGLWNNTTGTLNLTGTDTKANYEAALRSITYLNTSDDPTALVRTVSFTVSDGSTSSNTQTRNITVVPANDAPILENIELTPLVVQQLIAKQISSSITVKDYDDVNIESATVKFSINYQNGQDVLQFTNTASITGVWNAATGILTLTGSDTKANYQAALRSVAYYNSNSTPNTSQRTVVYTINDGSLNSNIQFRSISISVANNPPVLSAMEAAAVAYTENAAATAVTAALTVTDDGAMLQGAEVSISGNYQNGEDILTFTAAGTIVGNWNAATGKVTFIGSETKANYQTTLRSIRYRNTSDYPSILARTVSFVVNDGEYNSNIATRNINITRVNDVPVVSAINKSANISTDVVFTLVDFTSHFIDADADAMTQILIGAVLPANGTLYLDNNLNGVINAGEAVAANQVIVAASIPNIRFKPTAAWSGTTTFAWNGYDGTAYAAATANVSMAISNNTPPVIQAFTKNANEDTDLAYAIIDFNSPPTYTDAESNALSNVQIISLPANGTLYRDADSDGVVDGGEASAIGTVYTSAQLANLKFKPTANWNGSTSFSWAAQDNNAVPKYSNSSALANITIVPVNDAPTSANFAVTTLEDVDKVFATTDFPFTDIDAGDVLVRVRLVSVPTAGTLYNDANLNGVVDGGETLAATNIVNASDIALGRLKFKPVPDANGTPYRTFQFNAGDASAYSGAFTMTINVTPQQEPAALSAIEVAAIAYTENDGQVAVSSTINLTDVDNTQMQFATVQITGNYQQGQDFLSFVDNIFITSSWDEATGKLTLTGPADKSYFIAALRAVDYQNTSDNPILLSRTVSFIANDGTVNSNAATRNVNITPVNDAPQLANIEGTSLSYTENDAATVITSGITLTDPDDTNMEGASVQITGNYQNGQDVLSFVNTASITGSWNALSGTLTLTGSDTKANYASALRTVKYNNTSENPSALARTVSFVSTDGSLNSNTVTRNIAIVAVNDPPSSANNTISTNEDIDKVFADTDFPFTDIEGSTMTKIQITTLESAGTLYLDVNGNNTVDGGEDITLNQEITTAWIPYLKLKLALNASGVSYATIGFKVSDGSAYSVAAYTITVDVTPVNDLPTSADNSVSILEDNIKTFASAEFSFSDIDAGDVLSKIRIASLPGSGTLFNDANLNSIVDAGETVAANDEVTKAHIDANRLRFSPAMNGNGAPYALFQFEVSDGVAYSASAYNMTINVTAVNDAPSFLKGSDISICANSGAQTITNWATSIQEGPANESSQTVSFTVSNNNNALFSIQPTINASGTLSYTTAAGVSGSTTVTVSMQDDGGTANGGVNTSADQTFTITVNSSNITIADASLSEGNAGSANMDFTVSLSASCTNDVTVNYATSNGTAMVSDNDYSSTIGTLTITAGNTSGIISVPVNGDVKDENNETFTVTISSPSAGTITDAIATGTITDDDAAPSVTLSINNATIAENAGAATVTATLSTASSFAVTIDLAYTGTAAGSGTDYTAPTVTINIPAGSTTGTSVITSVNDAIDESNETVIVDISSVTNGTESTPQQVTTTITDDDASPTVTLSINNATIAENGGTATVTATLSAASGLPVAVDIAYTGTAAGSGTDYTAPTLTINIAAGSTTGTAVITSVNDALDENNETVIVDISSVTNGTESTPQQVTTTITDDDAAPTVTLSINNATIAENGGTATVTATLSAASGLPVAVDLAYTGTAVGSGTDYTAPTVTINIAAGLTTGTAVITSVNDALDENNETVIVDISSVTNATESVPQQVTTTITDDDAAPTVTLSINNATIAENGGTATVTATLSAVSGLPVTVNLTYTGTATGSGADYTAPTVTINIPAGSNTGTAVITSVNDALDENNETVIVDISSVTNGTESTPQQVTTTITDDDAPPTVTLSINNATIAENGGTTTVTATLSAASGLPIAVDLAYTGTAIGSGTDYTAPTVTINIAAGSTTGTAVITSVNDAIDENNETVIVDISSVTNATESTPQQVTTTITDDDAAPTATLSINNATIAENGGTATVTATLSAASGLPVAVDLAYTGTATGSGTDYTAPTVTINIAAGSTTGTAVITSVNDAIDENNETVIVDISSVTNATESIPQQVTTTITDDDASPTVTLSINNANIAENGGTAIVTANLSAASGLPVAVDLAYSGTAAGSGTDYTAPTVTINIAAGSTTGTAVITSVNDAIDENNETVIVDISSVTNGTESGTQQVTTTITDDDVAPAVTLSVDNVSMGENAGTATVTATLSVVSALPVTLDVGYTGTATGGGADYNTSGVSISIPAGSTTGSITLTAVQDLISEGDETIIVDITSVTNGTESGTQQVTSTIIDDEGMSLVSLSVDNATIIENAGTAIVTATLDAVSSKDVTINLGYTGTATGSGTDYNTTGTSITILAGSTTGTITLTSVTDAIDENNETIVVDIVSVTNAAENGSQQVTTTITDDDAAPTVTLSIDNATIIENAGIATGTATLSAASGLPVTIDLAYTGTAIGSGTDYTAPTVSIVIPAGSTTGTVVITSVDDAIDEADETVIFDITSVTNGAESGTQQVTTTITDDDAAPTLTLTVDNATIAENAGAATVTATLSAVSGLPVTVDIAYTGTATGAGTDYTAPTVSINIPAGSTTGTAVITSVDDAIDEADETVIVDITSVTNGTESGTQQVTTAITDDDAAPTVTLSVDNATIDENAGVSTVTATLSAVSGLPVTIDLGIAGTATGSGTDYSASAVTIIIPAGSTTGNITLTAVQDVLYEVDETIDVEITSVTNGTESGTQQVTTTILDDEGLPLVSLSIDNTTIAENAGIATVTATLDAVTAKDVNVNIEFTGTAIDGGTDYTASSASIFIPAGSISGTATITAVNDAIDETDETAIVDIKIVTNAAENGVQQVTTTITDDDLPPTVTLSVDNASIAESSGSAIVTATLSEASGLTVTIDLGFSGTATGGGTDYSVSAVSITIPAGLTTGTVTLSTADDAIDEDDETVIIDITSVTNGTESGTQRVATTITDDDIEPMVSMSVDNVTIAETGGVSTITVTLDNVSAKDITVELNVSGTAMGSGTDNTVSTTSVVIPAGSLTGTAVITSVSDALDEISETIIVDIASVTNATENGTQQVTVTITDDDPAPLVSLAVNNLNIAENAGNNQIIATIDAVSAKDITIHIGISGTSTASSADYTASSANIFIPAGSLTGSVTYTAIQDILLEGNETIVIDVDSVWNGTEDGMQQIIVNIIDDEVADHTPATNPDLATTNEDNSSSANVLANDTGLEDGGLVVTIVLDGKHGTAVVNGDNTITYTPNADYFGNDTITYQVCDADGDCSTGILSFTVVSVDDIPVASNDNVSTNEGSPLNISVTVNDAGLGDGSLSVSIATNGKHGTAAVNGDNTITYIPNANYFGADTITYQVCDLDGDCATAQVIVTVVTINQTPVVTPPAAATSIIQGTPVQICFTVSDADADPITATPVVNHGTVVSSGNGCFTYTSDSSYTGQDTLQVTFCDQEGACVTSAAPIIVLSLAEKPMARYDTLYLQTTLGREVSGCIEMVTTTDGLTATIITPAEHGVASIENQLCVKYSPDGTFTGVFNIPVAICNTSGLCDTVIVSIDIINVRILQGFSPNGDGLNEVFEIEGLELFDKVSVQIFNRWGNEVYKSEMYKNDWDGTSKNAFTLGSSKLPSGTYFYVVDFHDGKKPVVGYVYLSR